MKRINKNTFGPWALVTGASSGIGKEFARQLATSGLNLVLVARRLPLLEEVGRTLADAYGIRYRALSLDLSQEGFLEQLETVTRSIEAAETRARVMGRKLRDVEALPGEEASGLLGDALTGVDPDEQ